jgi:predicted Ser/Thr protein kinase
VFPNDDVDGKLNQAINRRPFSSENASNLLSSILAYICKLYKSVQVREVRKDGLASGASAAESG